VSDEQPTRASDVEVSREEYERAVEESEENGNLSPNPFQRQGTRGPLRRRPSGIDDAIAAAIVADWSKGVTYTKIGRRYGISGEVAKRLIDFEVPVVVPGMNPPSGESMKWLSMAALAWARSQPQLTVSIKDAYRTLDGTRPRTAAVVLLALAVESQQALSAQTGGVAPTMRTALYRMMAVHFLPKDAYEALKKHSTEARKLGVLSRDFWADPEPSSIYGPGWWEAESALRDRLTKLVRPTDPLARTGHVFGVVTETRGAAPPLAGAIRRRLKFYVPVWYMGGTGSIPRRLHVEQQMLRWAKRTDAEPHLLVITDYDPSGLVIANAVAEEVRGVDVQRIGMWPDLAPSAALTSAGIAPTKEDKKNPHAGKLWKAAVDEHGEDEYQAEAVDYAGWAGHVADAIEEHIDLDDVYDEELGPEWDAGDQELARLRDLLDECGGDVSEWAKRLRS
jgi:hypothetical protein